MQRFNLKAYSDRSSRTVYFRHARTIVAHSSEDYLDPRGIPEYSTVVAQWNSSNQLSAGAKRQDIVWRFRDSVSVFSGCFATISSTCRICDPF